MRFGILGPLLVDDGEGPVSLPARRLRVLLAVLLLHSGQAVPADELADVVWDGSPPPGAADTLRTYVMRLRRSIGPQAGARLVTRYPGYLLDADEDEVDLLRFARLYRDGAAVVRAGSWSEASRILTQALGLWRGPALADVPSTVLQRDEVPRLDQLRLQAQEWRIEADLHLARHADLVPELQALAAGHPLQERFHAQLMLALYRCGRPAEAVAAYEHARRALIAELGTEPGSELRTLHEQILTADPALAAPEPATRDAGTSAVIPRQLPGPVPQFVGRDAELAALTELARLAARSSPATVVISAIGGTAGVGKTALAVHWAHQVSRRFPDGQLYVNLRGYDPDQPVAAADALAGFLRALGVGGQDIPTGEDERAARYRSVLAGKRMLVVLDNARDVAQVRPLLPGSAGCAVVVTSRDGLAGLVSRDGAARIDLDLLPLADAVALLGDLIGSRASAEPDSAAELARLCCRLPLALRVAAELAAARPAAGLADLVAELGDQQRRLDLLDAGGDPRTAVRGVLSWSYQHLSQASARAFRLAGLHPGPDLDDCALAALAGISLAEATRAFGDLGCAHLAQPAGPGRHGMHDLLRAYARDLAASIDGELEGRAALTRLFDYYLSAASNAMDVLVPEEAHRRPQVTSTAASVPGMSSEAEARAWLDRERPNLVAVVVHCAGHGWARHATDLAGTLFRYLMHGSHLPEALTIYSHALQAARQSGQAAAEAEALNGLGGIGIMKGHFRDAASHYQAALTRYRQCDDRAGEARVLQNLGVTEQALHDFWPAADYFRQAIGAFDDAGDSLGAARALTNLAAVETELDLDDQASDHLQRALLVFREANDEVFEAGALTQIGELSLRRGELTQAAADFEQAMAIFSRIDLTVGVANGLFNRGEVSLRQGEYRQAIGYLQEALTLHRETGYQHGELTTLRSLARALHGAGQHGAARAELTAALGLAAETGNTYQLASTHRDLAESYSSAAEDEQARYHWQQALALFTELGAPQAEEVRARITTADQHALADS